VLPVVCDFLRRFPRIDVRMLLLDRPVDLIEEGLDVTVRIGALPDSSLIATRVGTVRQIVCASSLNSSMLTEGLRASNTSPLTIASRSRLLMPGIGGHSRRARNRNAFACAPGLP
jgi:DNA-binding transcriptional LysR family regulator